MRDASRARAARLRATPEGQRLMREQGRKSRFKMKYGMTEADYQARCDAQGGRCAICRQPPPSHKPILHVDHDHDSGRVRGLLCSDCNLALGLFGDSATRARRAADYLDGR